MGLGISLFEASAKNADGELIIDSKKMWAQKLKLILEYLILTDYLWGM